MTRYLVGWSWTAAAVAAAWCAAFVLGWMAWGPVPQPIMFTGAVKVEPQVVPQGGVIVVTREFVVEKPVTVRVTRNITPVGDGNVRPVYYLPESITLWTPGLYNKPRAHEIPEYVAPGRYRFDSVATWQVNPLRTERLSMHTVEFTVVAR